MRIRDGDRSDPGWKKVGSGIQRNEHQQYLQVEHEVNSYKWAVTSGQLPVYAALSTS